MFLSDLSIKRPVFTAMVMVALMTLGLLSVRSIGVDLFPDVSFPIVAITTVFPGAGPEEVEQQVTKPLEEAVSSINGIDQVQSFSRDSVSIVVAQFKLEADIKAASADVRDRVAGIRAKLPRDIRDPIVQRFDPSAIPIVSFALSSAKRNGAEVRQIAEDVLKPRLEAIDGVASVSVVGGREREIQIQVNRARVEALGMTLSQVAQKLQSEGFDLPAGRIATGAFETVVKTEGRFKSVEEIGDVVITSLASGAQVRLRELATIVDGFKEVRTITKLDGKEAVTVEVQKQGGTNTVAIAEAALKVVEKTKELFPPDMRDNVITASDTSVFIKRNIDGVTEDILFGGLMAIFVIFFFMLDWRSTFISSLSLPTSVVTTFFAMKYMGFTFNLLSLLGLSLSIGLLIDDAVVVRENIFRHMEKGKDPITAAREGTAEIGLAVMATTFTIVAVFVPVGFMGGLVGRMFKQFGLTVAAAVMVSLFVSFTLDPMMSARVMKPIEKDHHEKLKHHWLAGRIVGMYDAMDAYYRGVLAWALSHRWLVVAGATALLVGSVALTRFMGSEFVAPSDRSEFRLALEMPAGTSIAEMSKVAEDVERRIHAVSPHVTGIFTTVGPSEEANKAVLRVHMVKPKERPGVTQWDVMDAIRNDLRAVPGLSANATDLGMIEGPVEFPVTLFIRGSDYEKLQDVAHKYVAAVKSVPGAVDVDMSYRAGKPETSLRVNRARAADLGVPAALVAQTVRLALEGEVVAKYRDGDRENDVRLLLDPASRTTPEQLTELTVPSTSGRMGAMPAGPMGMPMGPRLVRVGEVASLHAGTGPGTIERMNRQRQIIINANLLGRSLGDVVKDIEKAIATIELPAGITYKFGGQTERMQDTFSNMGIALATAVLFIFFVLASQFESFIHPFTIMIALPLAIVGALLALFLTGSSLGMSSMIGIVLLMGLVTKNSILLVDYTNELRAQGLKMKEALLQAGPTRLRPILMTSAAMVLGMLPSATSTAEGAEFKAPMGIVVIGGVIASTFLTLLVVPVVYTWLDRFTSRGREEAAEEKAAAPTRVSAHEPVNAPIPAMRTVTEEG